MAPDVEAALERVVEPEVVVAVGQLVGLEAWRPPCEGQQRTARMLVEARVLRDAQDSLEPFDEILRRGGEVIDHLQVGLRVDARLDMVELLCQVEGTPSPQARLFRVLRVDVEVPQIAVRHGQLGPGRQLLQSGDRVLRCLDRFLDPSDVAEQARQMPQRVANAEGLLQGAEAIERSLLRVQRLRELAAQVAGVSAPLKDGGESVRRTFARGANRAGVVGGRFAMRAQRRCTRGSLWRVPRDRRRVTR